MALLIPLHFHTTVKRAFSLSLSVSLRRAKKWVFHMWGLSLMLSHSVSRYWSLYEQPWIWHTVRRTTTAAVLHLLFKNRRRSITLQCGGGVHKLIPVCPHMHNGVWQSWQIGFIFWLRISPQAHKLSIVKKKEIGRKMTTKYWPPRRADLGKCPTWLDKQVYNYVFKCSDEDTNLDYRWSAQQVCKDLDLVVTAYCQTVTVLFAVTHEPLSDDI